MKKVLSGKILVLIIASLVLVSLLLMIWFHNNTTENSAQNIKPQQKVKKSKKAKKKKTQAQQKAKKSKKAKKTHHTEVEIEKRIKEEIKRLTEESKKKQRKVFKRADQIKVILKLFVQFEYINDQLEEIQKKVNQTNERKNLLINNFRGNQVKTNKLENLFSLKIKKIEAPKSALLMKRQGVHQQISKLSKECGIPCTFSNSNYYGSIHWMKLDSEEVTEGKLLVGCLTKDKGRVVFIYLNMNKLTKKIKPILQVPVEYASKKFYIIILKKNGYGDDYKYEKGYAPCPLKTQKSAGEYEADKVEIIPWQTKS